MPASQPSSTPVGAKNSRKIGIRLTKDETGRFASSSSLGSPAPTSRKNQDSSILSKGADESAEERLEMLEGRMRAMEQENREMKEELWKLRDKLEEEAWARKRLEEKVATLEEHETEREEARETMKMEFREMTREIKEDLREEMKEVAKELTGKGGGEEIRGDVGGGDKDSQKYRCLILTDSNGRDSTPESVKAHMPREERDKYDIQIVVAYRLEDAFYQIRRKEIDVRGAYVVIDNITNNIKGNWRYPPEPPERVINRVAALRELIISSSAAAVVVAEVKPMGICDVRPFNWRLHEFLASCGNNGFGCKTQVRMEFLAADGTHVDHRYKSVIDRTYAYALLGTHVPCPVPDDNFAPLFIRRRWESEWPRLVGRAGEGYNGS